MPVLISWLLGLLVSVFGGGVAIHLARRAVDRSIERWVREERRRWESGQADASMAERKPREPELHEPLPRLATTLGVVERLFFTVLIGCGLDAIAGAAGAVLIVRHALNWTGLEEMGLPGTRLKDQRALLLGLLSLAFGLGAGVLIRGNIGLHLYRWLGAQ